LTSHIRGGCGAVSWPIVPVLKGRGALIVSKYHSSLYGTIPFNHSIRLEAGRLKPPPLPTPRRGGLKKASPNEIIYFLSMFILGYDSPVEGSSHRGVTSWFLYADTHHVHGQDERNSIYLGPQHRSLQAMTRNIFFPFAHINMSPLNFMSSFLYLVFLHDKLGYAESFFLAIFAPVKRYLGTSLIFLYWKKDGGDKERPTFKITRILIVKENRHNAVRGKEVFGSCSSILQEKWVFVLPRQLLNSFIF
jgi:hypothetical protein